MTDNLQNDAERDARRCLIRESLSEIASAVHSELISAQLEYPIYLAVPNSGYALLTCVCPLDPVDLDMDRIMAIVLEIVGTKIDSTRLTSRHLDCAMAGSVMGSAELFTDLGTASASP